MTVYRNPFADLSDNEVIDAIRDAFPDDTPSLAILEEDVNEIGPGVAFAARLRRQLVRLCDMYSAGNVLPEVGDYDADGNGGLVAGCPLFPANGCAGMNAIADAAYRGGYAGTPGAVIRVRRIGGAA